MEGYRVMPIREAARVGDIFVTVTGDTSVIRRRAHGAHEGRRHHGELRALRRGDRQGRAGRDWRCGRAGSASSCDEYTMADGRRLHLLGEGRLVNLSAAEGHPAAVMDMSFANQALAVEWVVKHQAELGPAGLPRAGRHRQGGRAAQARTRWAWRSTR